MPHTFFTGYWLLTGDLLVMIWIMDTSQNAFAETYFTDDSIKSLLELVSLLVTFHGVRK